MWGGGGCFLSDLYRDPERCGPSGQSARCPGDRVPATFLLLRLLPRPPSEEPLRNTPRHVSGVAPPLSRPEPRQRLGPPPPPWCMGLLIRGLMGAKPPTVKLVTSLGCGATPDHTRYQPPLRQQTAAHSSTHLGAPRQHQVASLANKHAAIFHQLFTVEEGEASEQVADLPLPALEEGGRM